MARTQRDPKTDEELIEWIKSKESIKELRLENYAWYQQCRIRGLNTYFPPKMSAKLKYEDKDLIEWIQSFETISEMRADDFNKYVLCKRRKLNKYFPKKLTRCGNPVGETKTEPVKERKMKPVLEVKEDKDPDRSRRMYRGMDYKDGNILCGRCLEVKPKTKGLICYTCVKIIASHNAKGIDTNKWNVKDYFCNTKITDGGRVFEIGIKVDSKTQNYLTMLGYGFIFKEEDPV